MQMAIPDHDYCSSCSPSSYLSSLAASPVSCCSVQRSVSVILRAVLNPHCMAVDAAVPKIQKGDQRAREDTHKTDRKVCNSWRSPDCLLLLRKLHHDLLARVNKIWACCDGCFRATIRQQGVLPDARARTSRSSPHCLASCSILPRSTNANKGPNPYNWPDDPCCSEVLRDPYIWLRRRPFDPRVSPRLHVPDHRLAAGMVRAIAPRTLLCLSVNVVVRPFFVIVRGGCPGTGQFFREIIVCWAG